MRSTGYGALPVTKVSSALAINAAAFLPGDFNHDGTVDAGDYVVWRKGLGTKYTPTDLDSWKAHFGQTYTPGSGTELSAVPEPAALVMLLVGAVLVLPGCRWRILLSPRWG